MAGVYLARHRRRALLGVGLGVVAGMLVLAAAFMIARALLLNGVPAQGAAAAAQTYDLLVRFLHDAIRTLTVLGLVIALGAYRLGPAAGAIGTRAPVNRAISGLRPGRVAEALAAGPVGPFVHTHLRLLQATALGVSARRRTFTWLQPVVWTSAMGPRDDGPTIPLLNCDECAVELTGDVWVVRELLARGCGGRRGMNDPRSRRTRTVCETCWGRLARAACTVDLPCGVCGRIRHCDASSNFGARFQALHACSAECARTVRRGPVRIVVTLRCQWCGEAFTARRRDARYCSVAHRKAAHRRARKSI